MPEGLGCRVDSGMFWLGFQSMQRHRPESILRGRSETDVEALTKHECTIATVLIGTLYNKEHSYALFAFITMQILLLYMQEEQLTPK